MNSYSNNNNAALLPNQSINGGIGQPPNQYGMSPMMSGGQPDGQMGAGIGGGLGGGMGGGQMMPMSSSPGLMA